MKTADKFIYLLKLLEWGADESTAELVLECIQTKRNILITGGVGVGKTLLLKELISMTDPETKFGYIYRHPSIQKTVDDLEIHSVDKPRVIETLNMDHHHPHYISLESSDFFVVDDVRQEDFDKTTEFLSSIRLHGTLGTCFLRNQQDAEFIFTQHQKYYDLMVYLRGYQKIDKVVLFGR